MSYSEDPLLLDDPIRIQWQLILVPRPTPLTRPREQFMIICVIIMELKWKWESTRAFPTIFSDQVSNQWRAVNQYCNSE